MGKDSKIEWTDHSWNPWRGCRRCTPECANCYMFRDQKRYGMDPSVVVRSKTTFSDPLKWKKPARVFVCSWSDFWIEDADDWREEAFAVMREADHHTYIIPTKRPGNVADRLPYNWGDGWPNVWGLMSAGTQDTLDKFGPIFLSLPFAVRGLSAEPLLEEIDIHPYTTHNFIDRPELSYLGLDWVIIGCESGGTRRPMKSWWAVNLINECTASGIPVFVKQVEIDGKVNKNPADWLPELRRREFPA